LIAFEPGWFKQAGGNAIYPELINELIAHMQEDRTPEEAMLHNGEQAQMAHKPTGELASYRDILEGMEQGIIVWSADRVCSFVNRRYFVITGSSETDLFVGQTFDTHMSLLVDQGLYLPEQVDALWEKMSLGKIVSAERSTPGGRQISLTVRPLINGSFVVSVTDVSSVKQHEEKLASALTRAEDAEAHAQTALRLQKTRQAEVDKLSEFTDWLHSCKSLTELYEVVHQAMRYIYAGSSGQLFIYSNSRDVLDGVCSWGKSELSHDIHAQDCWSLRRGRVFEYADGMIKYDCNHVNSTDSSASRHYICLPLMMVSLDLLI